MEDRNKEKTMMQARKLLIEYGQNAFKIAKSAILHERIIDERVYEALRYFMEECWYDVQHPALLSLACEAVGGQRENTKYVGAAVALLAGAADIHDDILDKSKIKGDKLTVFGKFGTEIAILAGDALLFRGLILLHEACKRLPETQKEIIPNILKEAFFNIGNAEVRQKVFKGNFNLKPSEYCKVIEIKASVAEACTRIGAIIGGGRQEQIDALGRYGKTLGFLMTIRDDFIDIFELDELNNRIRNECLPLPILYALQDSKTREKLISIIKKGHVSEDELQKILDLVMESKKVQKLREKMRSLIWKGRSFLQVIDNSRVRDYLYLLLDATIEDL